ncbi:MAG TPA: ABC transporter ATP-binding protein [Verrucomicrobiales bacterium]|nr:ABC transporter ATP-binding protein [Verrucomicrobiales bacterium]MEE2943504.1 ABC transporter ATP-binding protein [Verrucomicrobiota bacterium]HAH99164.1 ABC transporter ATP-binding protein [Verrucomicrobiales bacterium]|tara:strand:- start:2190 stop:2831 length:642 start_codon:yes stop_codon:yes gene_type:complete
MIALNKITLRQGDFELSEVCFELSAGEYGVLMGRSGCGKTTLLEAVCGLRDIESGNIILGDRDVTKLPPAERGVGFVPQDRALFPTLPVREQLAFALVLRLIDQAEIAVRVEELAELLGLTDLLDRMPDRLSGGEAQRVALGRALAHRPSVLCLDEPLAALDEELHGEMCKLLERVHKETGVTILHITHSPSEASRLAGCHFRLVNGKVTRDE